MNCRNRSVLARLRVLLSLVATLQVAPLIAAVTTEVRPVVLSGGAAAGVPGATYSEISSGTADVNDAGLVAFSAQLTGGGVNALNNSGLWLGSSPTSQTLIARSGDQPPGLPAGVRFIGGFDAPRLNNQGNVTFLGAIEPAEMPIENGVFTTAGGPLRLLAADRYPLPNTPGTPTVNRGVWFPALNDAGQSSFATPLSSGWSYWVDTPGQPLRRVISSGDPLPGGSGLEAISLSSTWLANNGRVAFSTLATLGPDYKYGLWSEVSGTLQLVAIEGGSAPGTSRTYNSIYNATMSPNGMLAYDAFMSAGRMMFAQRPDGTVRVVATTGMTIPGTAFTFTNFYEPRINSLGRVAFTGTPSSFPSSPWSSTVCFEDSLGLHMLTRAGLPAPGAGGAVFEGFEDIQFNDNGDLMFEAVLKHGTADVSDANDRGIWLRQRDGVVTLIAREGDFLDIAPGLATDLRRVLGLESMGPFGGIRQERRTLTNNGEVLFTAWFDNGTHGLFLSQPIPEPSTLVTVLLLAIAVATSRRPART